MDKLLTAGLTYLFLASIAISIFMNVIGKFITSFSSDGNREEKPVPNFIQKWADALEKWIEKMERAGAGTSKEKPSVKEIQVENQAEVNSVILKNDTEQDNAYDFETSYKVQATPYEEKRSFQEVNHGCVYEKYEEAKSLSSLEKGVIFAEIFNKPISMRKRV